jgi:hypothetical protein
MRLQFTLLIPLLAVQFLFAQNKPAKKIRLPAALREASGLYYAAPDSLWWHNDSGDQPRLFLTDRKGNLKKEVVLKTRNRDWEDLTADKQGNIYIGDFGNNGNARKDLRIYIFNPVTEELDSILFHYPDQQEFPPAPAQWNFNMEGFFWYNDTLHLFSKNRLLQGNDYTKYYTLPAQPGTFTATLQDSIHLKNRVVTAAAISPDGQTVALLAYYYKRFLHFIPITRTTVYTLPYFDKNQLEKKRVGKFLIPTQYECLDFIDNQSVYIGSERTPLLKKQVKQVQLFRFRKS